MIAAARGYRLVLTMPDTMSAERRRLLAAYGAELVLTPGATGMQGAVDAALAMAQANPGWFMPYQFENESNPRAHERTTAMEILADLDGRIDAFVAGIGTRHHHRCQARAQARGARRAHRWRGAGGIAGFDGGRPQRRRTPRHTGHRRRFRPEGVGSLDDRRDHPVTTAGAFAAARELARTEGVLAGISSGAAAHAARTIARRLGSGTRTLAILPDTGERYLSVEGLW